jgi:hypothetical protein
VSSLDTHGRLFSACRVLFGPGVPLDERFLAGLDIASVRRRFRKRATEVHPDRSAVLCKHPAVLAEAFKQVEAAYRTLCEHLATGRKMACRPPATPTCGTSPAKSAQGCEGPFGGATDRKQAGTRPFPGDHFWSGPIPARTLRLGEFMYYSGRIPWSELIRALAWQAQQAPRFGQLARSYGYLTPEHIFSVLTRRHGKERIGEAALRLGFLTNLQQHVVLMAQQRARGRIGDYFVRTGLVGAQEIEGLGRVLRAHNARVGLSRDGVGRW